MDDKSRKIILEIIKSYNNDIYKNGKELMKIDRTNVRSDKFYDDVINSMLELWNARERGDEQEVCYYRRYLDDIRALLEG